MRARGRRVPRLSFVAAALAGVASVAAPRTPARADEAPSSSPSPAPPPSPPSVAADFRSRGRDAFRGVTIGPIENAYHPGVGYGSPAYERTLDECVRLGATWVALTPFGRVGSLAGHGIDPTFEAPFEANKRAVALAVRQAHARGLAVMIVPHLWVESGDWRAKIDPTSDAAWGRWTESYRRFLLGWTDVAARERVELLSLGVELRSWVTGPRAPAFAALAREVRARFAGLLTYSANWDDVERTVVLGEVDFVGVNAFYPLADHDDATFDELLRGGERVREKVRVLADTWQKPVLFTEMGYTTRPNPAIRPWEWPDAMKNVRVDARAQAEAYRALLAPVLDEPRFAGFFVWRTYADPNDVSQEAEWGFSPRGKAAELVLRDAFAARFASDAGARALRPGFGLAASTPGLY